MLALHDRTRRSICRIVFLAVCPLPTVSLLLWAAWLHTPLYRRAAIDAIEGRLGTHVTLAAIAHPAPGRIRYEGLVLADPDEGGPLLAFDAIEAVREEGGITLSAHEGRLQVAGLDRLWEMMARDLAGPLQTEVGLRIGEVHLLPEGARPQSLLNVRARLGSVPKGRQASFEFRVDKDVAADCVHVRATRDRHVSPAVTLYEVDARAAPLPCPLIAAIVPAASRLGTRCRFQGYLWARQSRRASDAELVGSLVDCDLARLASAWSPHQIDGVARVDLQRIALRQGRLVQATGRLAAGPGVFDAALYHAAIAGLQLRPGPQSVPTRPPGARPSSEPHSGGPIPRTQVPFDQLAFKFHLSAEGLWIAGECENAVPGTLAVYQAVPILFDAAGQPQSVSALVRTLAPQNGDFVPATREADLLTRLLPLPTGLPARVARRPAGTP